jgi:ribosomal protein S18 acetylase RimI-like enzyme
LKIIELKTVSEMLAQIQVMHHLYPNLTLEKYESFLQEMVPHNYCQIAVFENETCVGITGCWFSTKLWSGKYLEIDSFVVDPDHRSKGIGKILTDYVQEKALLLGCTNVVLDAFVTNYGAHRFYYNQGYEPKGFHFVKILDPDGLT